MNKAFDKALISKQSRLVDLSINLEKLLRKLRETVWNVKYLQIDVCEQLLFRACISSCSHPRIFQSRIHNGKQSGLLGRAPGFLKQQNQVKIYDVKNLNYHLEHLQKRQEYKKHSKTSFSDFLNFEVTISAGRKMIKAFISQEKPR